MFRQILVMKPIINLQTWEEQLKTPQRVTKTSELYCVAGKLQFNQLIHNYFSVSAHLDALKAFEKESGMSNLSGNGFHSNESHQMKDQSNPIQNVYSNMDDIPLAEERNKIRHLIHSGNIDEAIDVIKELNPDILKRNKKAAFYLNRQLLIEMIRIGNIEKALVFARDRMKYETDPFFQKKLKI